MDVRIEVRPTKGGIKTNGAILVSEEGSGRFGHVLAKAKSLPGAQERDDGKTVAIQFSTIGTSRDDVMRAIGACLASIGLSLVGVGFGGDIVSLSISPGKVSEAVVSTSIGAGP